jgi:molybdopterin-guanine dinucleotide biosynthesis protein B
MKVLGIAGYSGAGKTTLLERLIPALGGLGQRVSVIKHAHHAFELDRPGKDSWRHRQAGACEVMIANDQRWALLHEQPEPQTPDWRSLLMRLDRSVDWVLIEGYKHAQLPKLEVWRAELGKPARYAHDEHIIAVATPASSVLPTPLAAGLIRLDLDQVQSIARWMVEQAAIAHVDESQVHEEKCSTAVAAERTAADPS